MTPESYESARYEALSERITHVKAGADRRAGELGRGLDRLADRLDARVERLNETKADKSALAALEKRVDGKADQADVDKVSSLLDRVLLGVLGFSLSFGGAAVWIVTRIRGG